MYCASRGAGASHATAAGRRLHADAEGLGTLVRIDASIPCPHDALRKSIEYAAIVTSMREKCHAAILPKVTIALVIHRKSISNRYLVITSWTLCSPAERVTSIAAGTNC